MRLVDEKITKLRKAKKSNQFVFAEAIHTHPLTVSNVETGKSKYSDDCIRLAKVHLDIVDMPLTDDECKVSKVRLYLMHNHVRDDRLLDARVICDEMAKIVNLEPVDKYLPMLYRLFEVALLLAEYSLDIAEEKLTYLQSRFDDMNDEHRYYFFSNLGDLNRLRFNTEVSIDFYTQALELSKNIANFSPLESAVFHCHIAYGHSYLEYPYRTILYIEKNRNILNVRETDKVSISSDLILALNYVKVENLKEAERLLESCLTRSKAIKDDKRIRISLHYYGFMYMKHENWKMAEVHFNQALQHCEKESSSYLAINQKRILCMAKSRNFVKANKLLKETKPYYRKCKTFSTYFEALERYITIKSRISIYDDISVSYIETVAIPHFINFSEYFLAIEYYELLKAYYKRKNEKKSLLAEAEISKICKRCFKY